MQLQLWWLEEQLKGNQLKKMYALPAKGDIDGAKKVELEEHNRCKKYIIKFSESMANAAVEAEQEVYNEGKFEDINVVHNKYDHTKNINYHLEEVQNETLKEEILY